MNNQFILLVGLILTFFWINVGVFYKVLFKQSQKLGNKEEWILGGDERFISVLVVSIFLLLMFGLTYGLIFIGFWQAWIPPAIGLLFMLTLNVDSVKRVYLMRVALSIRVKWNKCVHQNIHKAVIGLSAIALVVNLIMMFF